MKFPYIYNYKERQYILSYSLGSINLNVVIIVAAALYKMEFHFLAWGYVAYSLISYISFFAALKKLREWGDHADDPHPEPAAGSP